MAAVEELTPGPDSDEDEAWRAELTKRYAVVRPFLSLLGEVIAFDAAPEGRAVLEALRRLPELSGRQKVRDDEIVAEVVTGSWRRLVYAAPDLEPGTIDRRAYTFCVLESLHRALRRRDVFAPASNRWADPRAKLLNGAAWTKPKDSTLASLGLPENPDARLDELATTLDRSYRAVAERLPANTAVSFDDAGGLHLAPVHRDPRTRLAGRAAPNGDSDASPRRPARGAPGSSHVDRLLGCLHPRLRQETSSVNPLAPRPGILDRLAA